MNQSGSGTQSANGDQSVNLSVDDIESLLELAGGRSVEIGESSDDTMPFTQLDHALQTAAVLRQRRPGDPELAVAGLVHDIGHLLPGVGDAEHARAGASAVRAALGERVAGLVGLHVEAKRYLVARQSTYAGDLAADSVASLLAQGGPMSSDEQAAYESLAFADDALELRRADESAKVEGLVVTGLGEWMHIVRGLRPSTG